MPRNPGTKAGWLALAAIALTVFVAPAADATPISYNFTVDVISGPLSGTSSTGTFSYDNSSVVSGGSNQQLGLLTALDFTFNGTTYNAGNANTGWLAFDSAGNLTAFVFGNSCSVYDPSQPENCGVIAGTDQWFVFPGLDGFGYTTLTTNDFFTGNVTYARAASLPVLEPDALGLFGFGAFMIIGLSAGRRRRVS